MGPVLQELQRLEAAEEQVRIQENHQHIKHASSGSSHFYSESYSLHLPLSSPMDL